MEHSAFAQLETPRLRIRRFCSADLDALLDYRNDPEVARFQGWEAPYSREDASAFIQEVAGVSPGQPGRWFQFAVALPPTNLLIGDCALRTSRSDPRQAELGFSFARAYQRQGYATEAVGGLLTYAFTTLAMHRVFSITDTRNERAQHLLARAGFRREGEFIENTWFKGAWSSEFLYAQRASEWRTTQSRHSNPETRKA